MKKNAIIMKWLSLLIFYLLLNSCVFAQIKNVDILVPRNSFYVKKYFDSLSILKQGSKTDTMYSKTGDLILYIAFPADYESYYGCSRIVAFFKRINGEDICTQQIVAMSEQYAYLNIGFVKDNFQKVSEGKWKKELPEESIPYILEIYISKVDDFSKEITIQYSLQPKK